MTNRKWLRGMSDKELARQVNNSDSCDYCIRSMNGDCKSEYCESSEYCEEGIVEWLEQEHIEPMPRIKIGDVIYCNINKSKARFVVMSDTHASNLHGVMVRWRELNNIWKIERMNDEKEMVEVIWRRDNDT